MTDDDLQRELQRLRADITTLRDFAAFLLRRERESRACAETLRELLIARKVLTDAEYQAVLPHKEANFDAELLRVVEASRDAWLRDQLQKLDPGQPH